MSHSQACPRIAVAKVQRQLPVKYLEALEQNQLIPSCCRHPENHDIEALYSSDQDKEKGLPDIYVFHCTCGRKHTRLCVGGGDVRPFWKVV